MATYPQSPVALSTIDETTPTQLEDAALIGDALRQTRAIFKNLLDVIMNDNGTLKASAVTGVGDNSITTAMLQDLAVTTAKLNNLAVTTGKLADGSVTAAKLGALAVVTAALNDLAVTTAKLADSAVTTPKINNKAVDGTKLANDASVDANRAVNTDHIKDNAVATAKIADKAVTPAKMSNIGANKVLVGDGTGMSAADIAGDISASYSAGVLTLTIGGTGAGVTLSSAIVSERSAATGAGGSSAAADYTIRPAGDSTGVLIREDDPLNIVSIVSGNKIRIKAKGQYLVFIAAIGYSCGTHFIALVDPDGIHLVDTIPAASPAGAMTLTFGQGIITTADDNTDLQVKHWTEFAKATNGLGLPHGVTGVQNRYLYIQFTKIEEDAAT